jgi:hypothetical protein
VKNRDARSAKGKLRENLKKEGDDLDRRWEKLRKSARAQILGQPIGSPTASEWLDRAEENVQQRIANKMRLEALEWLPKPGPKPNPDESRQGDKYSALMLERVDASRGNMSSACKKFLNQAQVRFNVELRTAQNNWSRLRRDAAK